MLKPSHGDEDEGDDHQQEDSSDGHGEQEKGPAYKGNGKGRALIAAAIHAIRTFQALENRDMSGTDGDEASAVTSGKTNGRKLVLKSGPASRSLDLIGQPGNAEMLSKSLWSLMVQLRSFVETWAQALSCSR